MTDYLYIELAWGGYYACTSYDSDEVTIIRLLDFNIDAYHAALFSEKFDTVPGSNEIEALSPSVHHVPVDARGLLNNKTIDLVSRKSLTRDDLEGYMYYLEQFEVPDEERKDLADSLIAYSNDHALSLRLSILDGELQIEERI
jgi:hypothetical protein